MVRRVTELIESTNLFLTDNISAEFLLTITSLIMAILIPVAIMLINLDKFESPAENKWAKLVVRNVNLS